jgi:PII-like signaling protein
MSERRKVLVIFIDETEKHREFSLYEAIVRRLLIRGVAGATVNVGIMGYGAHHRVHHKGLLGISDDRPITITAVDTEEKLRSALPEISKLVKSEGLILLLDAEVIS